MTTPERRSSRSLPVVIAVGLGLAMTGCAPEIEPRAQTGEPAAEVATFESPRQTVVLRSGADVGNLVLRGEIGGRSPVLEVAPADGFVTDVRVDPGELVEAGETVLRFSPEPTRAEALEREIAMLEVELATEVGDTEAAAEASGRIDAIDATIAGRGFDVETSARGLVQGVRTGVGYSVAEGDELFSIALIDDLVVSVRTSEEISVGIADGAAAMIDLGAGAAPQVSATLEDRRSLDEQFDVELVFALADTDALDASLVGEVVTVVVPPGDPSTTETVWVEQGVLHRRNGQTFMLIEQGDGSLLRVDAIIRRRTTTHFELEVADAGRLRDGTVVVSP